MVAAEMLKQTGHVIARHDDDSYWVELDAGDSCGGCSAKAGCGQRLFVRKSAEKYRRFLIRSELPLETGEAVTIEMDESAVLKASLLVYGLPLLALLVCLMVTAALGLSDVQVAAFTLLGLILAALSVKTLSSRLSCNPRYHPQILSHQSRNP